VSRLCARFLVSTIVMQTMVVPRFTGAGGAADAVDPRAAATPSTKLRSAGGKGAGAHATSIKPAPGRAHAAVGTHAPSKTGGASLRSGGGGGGGEGGGVTNAGFGTKAGGSGGGSGGGGGGGGGGSSVKRPAEPAPIPREPRKLRPVKAAVEDAALFVVARCRLQVSTPVLEAPMVLACLRLKL
jgi:hypothetical protein